MLDCIEKLFNLKLTPPQKVVLQKKDQEGHSNRIQFCKEIKSLLNLSQYQDQIWEMIKTNIGKFVQLNKNAKEVLQELQKEYELVLLTNGGSKNQQNKIHQTGLQDFFSHKKILISGTIGFSKPDPSAFQIVEQIFPSNAQFYMVGDHWENDIIGAKNVGWKAIYLDTKSEHSDFENVKTISSLLELKQALDEFRY